MKLALQTRLVGGFLTVILICGAIATLVGVRMVGRAIMNQAQDKVRLDLNSARVIYEQGMGSTREAVRHTAGRFFLQESLAAGDLTPVAANLETICRAEGLDFLTLAGEDGRVMMRPHGPGAEGELLWAMPVIRAAVSRKDAVVSTELAPHEALVKEGAALAERARIRVIDTPRAKPSPRREATSGLVWLAAAPVLDAEGRILAVLCGGRLLNRDETLVDKIKDTVYQGEIYAGKDEGTATIFQGDLRIATNVRTRDGERAIGTRVSEEVHDSVLVHGRPWIERAFVVHGWYVTAYEPIRNLAGDIIGMLYVGLLERRFADMRRRALWSFVGIAAGGAVLAVAVGFLLTRSLTRPVGELIGATREFAAGSMARRVRPNPATREIGELGSAFNAMAASIQERDERLRRRAQEEISKAERLAMIGRLAAGVAHELNNPLGGILLLGRLLLKKAPAESLERENLQRIARDAERCQAIVRGLLDFARRREPKPEPADMATLIEDSLALVENQAIFHNITIERQLQREPAQVLVDAGQIQQVFVNLVMNAAEAMNGKGTLRIRSEKSSQGRVNVSFRDTGCGIPPEDLDRLFEPFFTTKEVGRGTGLGLSISHGIVEAHGGTITVTSRVGEGTTFVVSLPAAGRRN
ncbi:MAG: cache domain-containing protein [Kiritimatiellae bacterium]|nr:cache domain-containing protein [Kiritimatiellia bacterium]